MKKHLIFFALFSLLILGKAFSQTVYVNDVTPFYHNKKCKNTINKNYQPMDLSRALLIGKMPCKECKPPRETTDSKKKPKSKKKSTAAKPAKPAPAKK